MKNTGTHVLEHGYGMMSGSRGQTKTRPAMPKTITLSALSSPIVHWNLMAHPPLPLRALLAKIKS